MKIKLIARVIFFSICTLICFVQCYMILTDFVDDPGVMDMNELPFGRFASLPGLTLCNNNRLSLRKLLVSYPNVSRLLDLAFPPPARRREVLVSNGTFTRYRDTLYEILKTSEISHDKELSGRTISQVFDIQPDLDGFVDNVRCAKTYNNSVACSQLSYIDSIQDRRCASLLLKSAIDHDRKHRPELFEIHVGNKIENTLFYFNLRDLIKMHIDFEPEDYGDMKRQIGARLAIHPNDYAGSANDYDFYVKPGYKYEFTIQREDVILTRDCLDYDSRNDLRRIEGPIEPRLVLGQESCIQNCIVKRVIRWSRCWPNTMPYFRNDSLDPDRKFKPCGWYREGQYFLLREILQREYNRLSVNSTGSAPKFSANFFTEEMKVYRRIKRLCMAKCPLPCRSTKFSITMAKSIWPTDMKVRLDKSGRTRQSMLRFCCASITIKFMDFHYPIFRYKPKHNFSDIVGNLGGLLAVWLGISIVSVYHAIQKFVDLCHRPAAKIAAARSTSNIASVQQHPKNLEPMNRVI